MHLWLVYWLFDWIEIVAHWMGNMVRYIPATWILIIFGFIEFESTNILIFFLPPKQQNLDGNIDPNTVRQHHLELPIVGVRHVRLVPLSNHTRTVCLRFELFGCIYQGKCVWVCLLWFIFNSQAVIVCLSSINFHTSHTYSLFVYLEKNKKKGYFITQFMALWSQP